MSIDETPTERPDTARNGPRRKEAVEVVAAALACGTSVQNAAKRAGVGRRTVTRWLADPRFRGRVDALRNEAVDAALSRLSAATSGAVDALTGGLQSGRAETRIKAAKLILDATLRFREFTDLAGRVVALERSLRKAAQAGQPPTVGGPDAPAGTRSPERKRREQRDRARRARAKRSGCDLD